MTGAAPLGDDHALLCAAVRDAGAVALDFFRGDFAVREKKPGDPVTDADHAVNDALRARLTQARPDYGWLSEEGPDDSGRRAAARCWVIDPIDGTKGFVAGNEEWVVSAALVEAGRPVAAAILNPATGAFFDAVRGGGTRRDGKAVRATRAASMHRLVIGSSRNEQRRQLWTHLVTAATVKAIDAIAYKLALVADGTLDATIALRPKSDWDIAAGDLLIAESGGVMTDADGNRLRYNQAKVIHPNLIAAGPVIYPALRAVLDQR